MSYVKLASASIASALLALVPAGPARAAGSLIGSLEKGVVAGDPGAGDSFGYAIAIDGDTAVVGVPLDDAPAANAGSVYVFVRSGGFWTLQQKLVPSDGAASDLFGDFIVGISGNTIVVGAPLDDGLAGADQGSAYVFVRSGTTWTQQQKIVPADAGAGDWFGYEVAISGDTISIGAVFDDGAAGADQGSAYVFLRSGTVWSQQAKLLAADASAGDQLGAAVGIDGDTVAVGAGRDDGAGGVDQGAAYVFRRTGTSWSQEAKLVAADGAASDYLGGGIAIDVNTVLLYAAYDDTAAGVDAGSAYVFRRNGTSWSQEAKLTASDGAAFDYFGFSVALSGDVALVGAPDADGAAGSNTGTAYVFTRSGATWTQVHKILSTNAVANDEYGWSVALDGQLAAVGRPGFDATYTDQGKIEVFSLLDVQVLVSPDEATGDRFGWAVAIDNDTAVVGAPGNDGGATDAGAVYIFERSGSSWVFQQKFVPGPFLFWPTAGAQMGLAVAIDGDRIAVGVPFYDILTPPRSNTGAAIVFRKVGGVWGFEWSTAGPETEANLGYAVDIDDGTLAASAPWADPVVSGLPRVDQGVTQVYEYNAGTGAFDLSAILSGGASGAINPGALLGYRVAVGGSFLIHTGPGATFTHIFQRSGGTWANFLSTGGNGHAVAPSDTVGYLIGKPFETLGGRVAIYNPFCLPGTCPTQLLADDAATGDELGFFGLSSGGGRIAAGAHGDDDYGTNAGAAYVWKLDGVPPPYARKLVAPNAGAFDDFGATIGVTASHALVGADQHDGVGANSGAAYVYALTTCGNAVVEGGESCDDGNVVDGDGCSGGCRVEVACEDAFDNDGDGSIDFPADSGCTSAADLTEQLDCADGLDNDGDGLADYPADPGCWSAAAKIENPQCNDGINNDPGEDSLIDLADPQCGGVAANPRETAACGLLGLEPLPLIAGVVWASRRRSRFSSKRGSSPA